MVRWMIATLSAGLALTCGGCGSGMSPVTGVVTVDGKPLAKAMISLQPVGKGRPATGMTDDAGRFSLDTLTPGDGVSAGEYKVVILVPQLPKSASSEDKPLPGALAGNDPAKNAAAFRPGVAVTSSPANDLLQKVPAKYRAASSSPLTVKVPAAGEIKLEIQSEPAPSSSGDAGK